MMMVDKCKKKFNRLKRTKKNPKSMLDNLNHLKRAVPTQNLPPLPNSKSKGSNSPPIHLKEMLPLLSLTKNNLLCRLSLQASSSSVSSEDLQDSWILSLNLICFSIMDLSILSQLRDSLCQAQRSSKYQLRLKFMKMSFMWGVWWQILCIVIIGWFLRNSLNNRQNFNLGDCKHW